MTALAEMVKAEKLDPNNPLTHLNLGHVYRVQERIQDARTELETAVRLRPALSSAVYQLAMVYRQLGEQERARKALDRFQKLNSEEKEQEEDPQSTLPSATDLVEFVRD